MGRLGHAEIEKVYPRRISKKPDPSQSSVQVLSGAPSGVVYSPQDGVFLAFDLEGIVTLARKADCIVELVPQVGDFVAAGSPLFRIYGGQGGPSARARRRLLPSKLRRRPPSKASSSMRRPRNP